MNWANAITWATALTLVAAGCIGVYYLGNMVVSVP